MKRFLSTLVCLLLAVAMVCSLASCDAVEKLFGKPEEEHTHSYVDGKCECGAADPNYQEPAKPAHEHAYSADWSKDAYSHWHVATCQDNESCKTAVSAKAAHAYGENGNCACGATVYEAGLVEGENKVVFSAAEIEADTATRTLLIVNASDYSFKGDIFVAKVVATDGTEVAKNADYTYTLAAGKYEVSFGMFSIFQIAADASISLDVENKNAPAEDEDDNPTTPAGPLDTEASELVIGDNTVTITDGEAGVDFTIVVTAAGMFSFTSNDLGANIYSADDNLVDRGVAYLEAGTYKVSVYNPAETAGTYTLTVAYTAPEVNTEGTQDNPIVIETIPTTLTGSGTFDVYYTYTATEDCSVSVTFDSGNLALNVGENYFDDVAFVKAGETLVINIYADGEDDEEFSYSLTLGEYAEQGEQLRPNSFYPDDEFTCAYPGGNDVTKFVWYKANIYDNGYYVITFADRVNAKVGTDVDNLVAVTDATTKVAVSYGDTLYLAIQSSDLAEAEIAFTTSWEFLPGTSSDNPYIVVEGDNTNDIPAGAYELYFAYTPTANGTITLTYTDITFEYYSTEICWWDTAASGATFNVFEGVPFELRAYDWADYATSVAFNLAFEEKAATEITGEKVDTGVITTPASGVSTVYTYTATQSGVYMVNVLNLDSTTWFQMYDANDDSWPRQKELPITITLSEDDVVKFRLYGWSADAEGVEVTVEIYFVSAIEEDDDQDDPIVDTTLDLGENSFVVDGESKLEITFTPSAAGEYTITVNTENGVVAAMVGYDYAMYNKVWTFVVAESDVNTVIPLEVATIDYAGGTISVTLTKAEEIVAPSDISGVYTGTDMYGNAFLTVTIDAATSKVIFTYNHPMMGPNSVTATYEIVDGVMNLYDENGDALNPLAGKITLTGGVPTAAAYNGNDYTLALASSGNVENEESADISGVYTGTDMYGNAFLTVTIDAATSKVIFTYNHPMMGPNSVTATYEIVDGVMNLYDENGDALNPLAGMITLTDGVPTAAAYNGNDYTLAIAGASEDEVETSDISGIYTGTDMYGNAFLTVTIDAATSKVIFTFAHPMSGTNSVTATYEIVDGVMNLYDENGNALNPLAGAITLTDGVPTAAAYNGNDYTLTLASSGNVENEESADISGVYTGTDMYGNAFLTVTIDAATSKVIFTYNHPLMGPNSVTATYEIVDGVMNLYDENGAALNPLAGMITLTDGVPTAAAYNGNDYTLALASAAN